MSKAILSGGPGEAYPTPGLPFPSGGLWVPKVWGFTTWLGGKRIVVGG